jgi:hypothetical protein
MEKELSGAAKRQNLGAEAKKEETNNNVVGKKDDASAKKEKLVEGPSLTKPLEKVAPLVTKPSLVKPAEKPAETSPAASPDTKPSLTAKVETAKVLVPPPKPGGDSGSSPKPAPRALVTPKKPTVDVTPPSGAGDAGERKSASDSSCTSCVLLMMIIIIINFFVSNRDIFIDGRRSASAQMAKPQPFSYWADALPNILTQPP